MLPSRLETHSNRLYATVINNSLSAPKQLLFHRFPVILGIAASLASVLDISSLEELSPNRRRDYHMASHFATDYRDSGGCKDLSPFIAFDLLLMGTTRLED